MGLVTKKGDRVRLVRCTDPHTRLTPGEEGTVTLVDGFETVHVHWDSGSRLGLIPGTDQWEVIVYAVRERVINLGCPDDGDGWGTMYGASTRERAQEVAEVYRGRFDPQHVEVTGMTRTRFDALNAACPDQGPGAIDRPLVDGEGG